MTTNQIISWHVERALSTLEARVNVLVTIATIVEEAA